MRISKQKIKKIKIAQQNFENYKNDNETFNVSMFLLISHISQSCSKLNNLVINNNNTFCYRFQF